MIAEKAKKLLCVAGVSSSWQTFNTMFNSLWYSFLQNTRNTVSAFYQITNREDSRAGEAIFFLEMKEKDWGKCIYNLN